MSDWVDPDDAPPFTADVAARAEIRHGSKLIRAATGTYTRSLDWPGRPPLGEEAKEHISLRVDRDIVEFFRSGGAGWQTRMNAALRKVEGL
jgi:uncharacterized protein (DUF4415 family)